MRLLAETKCTSCLQNFRMVWDSRKCGSFKAAYLSFHWLNNSWNREFELVTRGFELITCGSVLVIHGFELDTCGFELVTRGFELATGKVELVTCEFEFVDLNSHFWIATCAFKLSNHN